MQIPSQPAQRGITLIELVFTIAVALVLCAVALPSLHRLMQSSRAGAAYNAMIASLNLARGRAVARQVAVVVCPSTDQRTCDGGYFWQAGWIVFEDTDHNAQRASNERLVEAVPARTGIAIASSTGRRHVTYRGDGSATGTNLTLTFCDHRDAKRVRTIVVNNGGRPRQGRASHAKAAVACAAL